MFFCAHPRFPNTLITSQAPSSWIQYFPRQYWLLPGGKTMPWKHFYVIVYKDFFVLGQKLKKAQTCQQFSSPACLEDPPPPVAQTVRLLLFFSSQFCGSRWLVALIQFCQKAVNDFSDKNLMFSWFQFFKVYFLFTASYFDQRVRETSAEARCQLVPSCYSRCIFRKFTSH